MWPYSQTIAAGLEKCRACFLSADLELDVAILTSAKVFWVRAAVCTGGGAEEHRFTKQKPFTSPCNQRETCRILSPYSNDFSFWKQTWMCFFSGVHACLCTLKADANQCHQNTALLLVPAPKKLITSASIPSCSNDKDWKRGASSTGVQEASSLVPSPWTEMKWKLEWRCNGNSEVSQASSKQERENSWNTPESTRTEHFHQKTIFTGRTMDEDWAEVHAWLLNTHGTVSFGQYAMFTATFFFSQIYELWEILSLATKQLKSPHHIYF